MDETFDISCQIERRFTLVLNEAMARRLTEVLGSYCCGGNSDPIYQLFSVLREHVKNAR